VAYHEGVLREAIHRFKYRNVRGLAEPLGELLASYMVDHSLPADVVVPVPLHPARLADRGYNQSALLARELGRRLDLPVVEDSLLRVRHTRQQVGLSIEERRRNVADAFACRDDRLAGCRVLLIDDVYTTGATLNACGEALIAAGAASAWGLTLAHGR
jgi:ComF family protein